MDTTQGRPQGRIVHSWSTPRRANRYWNTNLGLQLRYCFNLQGKIWTYLFLIEANYDWQLLVTAAGSKQKLDHARAIKLNAITVKQTTEDKYLEIPLDKNVHWKRHFGSICTEARTVLMNFRTKEGWGEFWSSSLTNASKEDILQNTKGWLNNKVFRWGHCLSVARTSL